MEGDVVLVAVVDVVAIRDWDESRAARNLMAHEGRVKVVDGRELRCDVKGIGV